MHPLEPYIRAWRGTAGDIIDLLPTLSGDDWSKPTDLPEWTVHDVAAHLAHLEAVLAGHDTEPQGTGKGSRDQVSSGFTQMGVDARADRPPADLIEEFRAAVEVRSAQFDAELPDPGDDAPVTPGGIDWTWEVLLRNRAIDAWTHEQDIRRAVGRPGSLGSGGAQITTYAFTAGMPFVLGKRIAPPAGTSVVWRITGEVALEIGAIVGADGRAASGVADDPTSILTLTNDVFAMLCAGRRGPDQVDVEIDGDEELGRAVLAAMTLTG